MNQTEFQESIQAGLGAALLYARAHDVSAFRDVILDACLHCYSVAPEMEGTRASYLYELVRLLPDRQFYGDQVVQSLAGSADSWDALQRFEFAAALAGHGDRRTQQAMYAAFEPGPQRGEAIALCFVELDGLPGFLFAAAQLGALLLSRPETIGVDWLWSQAVECCGEEAVTAALNEAARTDPRMEAYRRRVLPGPETKSGPIGGWPKIPSWQEIPSLGYDQLAPQLQRLRAAHLRRWSRQASPEELVRAAHGLLASESAEQQLPHLRIFSERAFPFGPGPLLRLAASENENVWRAAVIALTQIQHPAIRELALQAIQDRTRVRSWAVAMLDRNWQAGDHERALSWFEGESDREARHGMELDLLGLWKHHPAPEGELHLLERLYRRGPCSSCREQVVRRWRALDRLPESVRVECAYDANPDIRALVAEE